MIDGLPAYADYRPSGVPWAAHVPRHWQVLRLRHVCALSVSSVDKHVVRDEIPVRVCNYVHAYKNDRITTRVTLSAGSVKPAELERFRLFPGDVLITKDSESWTDIGVPSLVALDDPGVVCGYHLAILRPRQGTIGGYVLRALQAPGIAHQLHAKASGVTRFGLSLGAINGVWLPVPPASEQAAIVRFLDWATRRVDRAIRAKRRLVALLTEQKQAIIHRAVTQGLDPSVPMKASGIPWLGEIPAHWEAVRLGRLSTAQCDGPFGSGLKSAHYTDSGVRVIRLQNIGHGEFLDRAPAYISARHYASLGYHDVISGDLLIAGLGDNRIPAGRACVAPPDIGSAMVKADCFRFRLIADRATPHFVALQLSSTAPTASAILSTGATRLRINLSSTAARTIALPPVQEQELVLTSVERLTAPLDATIARTQRQIDLLRDYRARLVADVVTGKLDVRAFAETLPDEAPDDIEAIEADVDEDADDDETGDGADEG